MEDSMPAPPRAVMQMFNDPDHYATVNGLAGSSVHAQRREPFTAYLARLDLGTVRLRQAEASASVTMGGAAPDNHSFTFSIRPSGDRILSGRAVPWGMIFVPRPNEHLFTTSPSRQPWPWASIGIDYEDLAIAATALAGRAVSPSRRDTTLIQPPEMAYRRLVSVVGDAAALAAANPGIADCPASARALAGSVTEALVACLVDGEIVPERGAVRRHHRIMARLARLLDDRASEPLTLAEICAEVGAAQRTLNAVCHEFAGSSVANYIRGRRLNLARRALLDANPRETRVGDVAARFGFWELGRFAAAYRTRFGEMPSHTLRRQAD